MMSISLSVGDGKPVPSKAPRAMTVLLALWMPFVGETIFNYCKEIYSKHYAGITSRRIKETINYRKQRNKIFFKLIYFFFT
jgi:hypothetical protein